MPNLSGKGKTSQLRVRENLIRKKCRLEFPLRDKKQRAGLRVGCVGEPDFQSSSVEEQRAACHRVEAEKVPLVMGYRVTPGLDTQLE